MKIILVFVTTLDGKVTKWGDPHVQSWTSVEDQNYFKKIWNDNRLIIMGSNTFNADPLKPSVNNLLVVMTSHPSDYKRYEIPGQLEFTDKSPTQLAEHFEREGYKQMTVVGGAHVATSFFKDQLIDELWLTIEPKIFGARGNFVLEEKLDINLRLVTSERVNEDGTLILKYAVVKNETKHT